MTSHRSQTPFPQCACDHVLLYLEAPVSTITIVKCRHTLRPSNPTSANVFCTDLHKPIRDGQSCSSPQFQLQETVHKASTSQCLEVNKCRFFFYKMDILLKRKTAFHLKYTNAKNHEMQRDHSGLKE